MVRKSNLSLGLLLCGSLAWIGNIQAEDAKPKELFTKRANVPCKSDSSISGKVLSRLGAAEKVQNEGPDANDPKTWQKVRCNGKIGVIAREHLAVNPPKKEIVVQNGTVVAKYSDVYVKSSAAAKGVSEAGLTYAVEKSKPDAIAEIFTAELINKQITTAEMAAYAKSHNLSSTQGDSL